MPCCYPDAAVVDSESGAGAIRFLTGLNFEKGVMSRGFWQNGARYMWLTYLRGRLRYLRAPDRGTVFLAIQIVAGDLEPNDQK